MAPIAARAFVTLFQGQFAYVCQVLRRLGVQESDLDDACQEVFLAVHGKWETYDATRPVKPWLVGFAFRVAANVRRRRKRIHSEIDESLPSTGAGPELDAARTQATSLALKVLQKMEDERRDIFVMHDLEEMNAPEIADVLQIPLNTVYSRLRTARIEFEEHAARITRRSA
jgi:RNA polymerase sigma-70 factor, ECF subfamily